MRRAFLTATLVVVAVAALPAIDAVGVLGALGSAMTGQRRSPTSNRQPIVGNAIYITHVTVIDTETGKEVQDRTVVISGERIASIEESKNAKVPSGVRIVDRKRKYLIPGLWDMHAHPFAPEHRGTYFPLFLANGITGGGVPAPQVLLPSLHEKRASTRPSSTRMSGLESQDMHPTVIALEIVPRLDSAAEQCGGIREATGTRVRTPSLC